LGKSLLFPASENQELDNLLSKASINIQQVLITRCRISAKYPVNRTINRKDSGLIPFHFKFDTFREAGSKETKGLDYIKIFVKWYKFEGLKKGHAQQG
jgi:hypothetical protein